MDHYIQSTPKDFRQYPVDIGHDMVQYTCGKHLSISTLTSRVRQEKRKRGHSYIYIYIYRWFVLSLLAPVTCMSRNKTLPPGNYELKVSNLKLQQLLKKDMMYFIILTACCRNPANKAGLDKTLRGEKFEFFVIFFKPGHIWTVVICSLH